MAVLRGREYRIDFYNGDGTRTPGPRLAVPWKPVDDDERTRLTDSINTQRRKQFDDMLEDMRKQALNPKQPPGPGGEKIILVDGMPIRTYGGERMPPPTPPRHVLPNEIPDYLPAVERIIGAFRADADNRLWIRPKPPRARRAAAERSTTSSIERARWSIVCSFRRPYARRVRTGRNRLRHRRDGSTVKIEKHSFK